MVANNRVDIFSSTIDISKLTFGDWQVIGEALGKEPGWAYYRWAFTRSSPDLSSLTLEDWERIGLECGFKPGWAYYQFKEHGQ